MVLQSQLKDSIISLIISGVNTAEIGSTSTVTPDDNGIDVVDIDATSLTVTQVGDEVLHTIEVSASEAVGDTINAVHLKLNGLSFGVYKHTDVTKTSSMIMEYRIKTKILVE